MKIIFLEGKPNTGKTTTLGIVYDLITNGMNPLPTKTPLGGDQNDFECIVNYNGQNVAIYTMGDFSTYLSKAITKYDNQGCDVFICALSNNNLKIRARNKIKKYNNIKVSKTLKSDILSEHQANTQDANIIINHI